MLNKYWFRWYDISYQIFDVMYNVVALIMV